MTEPKLTYLGPIPKTLSGTRTEKPFWRRLPIAALVVVGVPTLVAMIYYLGIASPRYVSESQFVVRAPNQAAQPSGWGVALQGVMPAAQNDAFAVHQYVRSRDAMNQLIRQGVPIAEILSPEGVDPFSRHPGPGQKVTQEALHKGFQKIVSVGHDSTTGISTLRVQAFKPSDARMINEALLAGGEQLVNRLNLRAANDAVAEAEVARQEAQTRLSIAQQQLTAFRNRERIIDPGEQAAESAKLIGELMVTVATLRAERSQLAAEAPQSPQLGILDGRIRAFDQQIAAERARVVGGQASLAPMISVYEDLTMARELADKELGQATASLISAQQEARRQKLYLDRIVNPSLPDEPSLPRRWRAIFSVFASAVLVYALGYLVWAGVREHRQV